MRRRTGNYKYPRRRNKREPAVWMDPVGIRWIDIGYPWTVPTDQIGTFGRLHGSTIPSIFRHPKD